VQRNQYGWQHDECIWIGLPDCIGTSGAGVWALADALLAIQQQTQLSDGYALQSNWRAKPTPGIGYRVGDAAIFGRSATAAAALRCRLSGIGPAVELAKSGQRGDCA
jgi:hypothetical protein